MYEKEIKEIGLFFFLALLDEKKAKNLGTRAVSLFLKRMKKNPQAATHVEMVFVTKTIWKKSHSSATRGRPQFSPDSGWLIPANLDVSPWMEFQKSAPEDEFLILIWSQILQITNHDLSMALGITEGTIRYRLGRAFRRLGGMQRPLDKKIELVKT